MRDDRNPPRDERVFAIPNIVPVTARTEELLFSNPYQAVLRY
jgi:hypothetical protein